MCRHGRKYLSRANNSVEGESSCPYDERLEEVVTDLGMKESLNGGPIGVEKPHPPDFVAREVDGRQETELVRRIAGTRRHVCRRLEILVRFRSACRGCPGE